MTKTSGTKHSGFRRLWAVIILPVCMIQCCSSSSILFADDSEALLLFENSIRPVLSDTCFRCHGDPKISGGFRVDSRDALLKGGDSGAAVVPGNPDESLLLRALRRSDDVSAMPPEEDQALRPDQIRAFEEWIRLGAPWPESTPKFESQKHWAFLPLQESPVPEGTPSHSFENPIDAFVVARQQSAGRTMTEEADRRTLIRRVTFDLTGLPPAPEDVEAFVSDQHPDAWLRVINRLLDSRQYGEHWGRHWLDVVRYADTAGETADYPVPLAWKYRNYVIDAFNEDLPYDQFLREQIAGDILARRSPDAVAQQSGPSRRALSAGTSGQTVSLSVAQSEAIERDYASQVTATGYLAISRRFGFDSENYHHLTIQDTIDTLGQSVLGLSIGCARCHDHKFDDISMADYYGLYGIFDSTRYAFPGSEQKQKFRSMVPLVPPDQSIPVWREFDRRVARLAQQLDRQKQPVTTAILRSLHDMDGDFEMQAPAAGGSNGVLVPPWLYEGKIAVTTAAQSPFRNLYARGRVGASIAADSGAYQIRQSLHPEHRSDDTSVLYANLDFRLRATTTPGPTTGFHHWTIGATNSPAATEVLIGTDGVYLRSDAEPVRIGDSKLGEWQNIQLTIRPADRTVSGRVGTPDSQTTFSAQPLPASWSGVINETSLWSGGTPASEPAATAAIDLDHLGIQKTEIAPVSTTFPLNDENAGGQPVETEALNAELEQLVGSDDDFEMQLTMKGLASPWEAGPNSVVSVSSDVQSPFSNLFPSGSQALRMPNHAEYDGFGRRLKQLWKKDDTRFVAASWDFCCLNADAGGDGSWRFYLGHGPGNSAAAELFVNGKEFFRRSGDAREVVSPVVIGSWYQVQLIVDLQQGTYRGFLTANVSDSGAAKSGTDATAAGKAPSSIEFSGNTATGWDGQIDYTFIDSYGHIGGVRPALAVDNYTIQKPSAAAIEKPLVDAAQLLTELRQSLTPTSDNTITQRRERVLSLRSQIESARESARKDAETLNRLLTDGPFAMTYGMAEGTPHNVRIQQRGEPDRPGEEVPRGFLKALGGGSLKNPDQSSGRLELADWLTTTAAPLTARVMANRIWQYHFGRGIVRTPNDFGVRGQSATHPELLDALASALIRSGWSIKSMHRMILQSAVWKQSATNVNPQDAAAADELYVGFRRRRLSAEEIRDSILVVSGELNPEVGKGHPFPSPVSWGFSQHGPFSAVYDHNHRSVYLMSQRLKRHPFLALFDGPDPNSTTPDRLGTTVPTQALFFMNDPLVHRTSDAWAGRLQSSGSPVDDQIRLVYRAALGRPAAEDEVQQAKLFLDEYSQLTDSGQTNADKRHSMAAFLRTIIGSNEFLHID